MPRIVYVLSCMFLLLSSIMCGVIPVSADKPGSDTPVTIDDPESGTSVNVGYELEPNNDSSKADWINAARVVYGKIQTADDIDFWKFKAPGDGALSVTLQMPKDVNYRLQVYGEDKKEITHSDQEGSTTEQIDSIPITKDHWYYLAVSSSNRSFNNKLYYMIRLTYIPVGLTVNPDTYEPNNSPQEAKGITGNDFIEATIHDAADVDYYKMSHALGSTINLSLTDIPEGMDLDLYLLDSNFKPVMKSCNAKNSDESIVYQGDPGTYYVKVEFNKRSTIVMNKYQLRVAVKTIPVILVPGIGGSRLSMLEKGILSESWLNLSGMVFNESNHMRSLSLKPKEPGSNQVVQLHPEISILPEAGDDGFHAIEYLDYGVGQSLSEEYFSMAQKLQSIGYQKGRTLFGFPYDWRLSGSTNSTQLKQTIDRALQNSGAKQVQLVAHSMGGILIKETLLSNPSYQQKVRKVIYIGTPFLGAPRAFEALTSGYNFDIPPFSEKTGKQISQFAPAVFELLPSRQFVEKQKFLYLRDQEQLKPLSYQDLYSNRHVNSIYQPLLKYADAQHAKWDSRMVTVPQYAIIGEGQYTPVGYEVKAATNQLVPMYDKAQGDGTVPVISSSFSLKDEIKKKFYINSSHLDLVKNKNVIEQVVNLLKGIETTLTGMRDKPQPVLNQQDYLIIYREDGEFPEFSLDIAGKQRVFKNQTEQERVEEEIRNKESKDMKIDYIGNVIVIFLPLEDANRQVRMVPQYQVQKNSGIIIERHHVNTQTNKDNVTNHSIKSNGQSIIE
ncbi:lipase/acyltransferase domain-containing protein [Brevibacillus ginsengisoli]|uniref:lipase/acyltransferase domain-containing protein n=1 Tax=Brevibacillus ginsengisoli TaxID=363854 RepID=UPI003CE9BC6A